ncbi:unnamed protein product [Didymodactylos carnosus]|uniref:Uncharacterized protein n=1 Tax=Didymodactylos carnosus TaxID=1234261 RepID=A0A815F5C8_9BILA|nr:unnamed protein product [Didymodactylos carnosus]CAF4167885.1 unnamed protein product [Didymodactylos carnosus]
MSSSGRHTASDVVGVVTRSAAKTAEVTMRSLSAEKPANNTSLTEAELSKERVLPSFLDKFDRGAAERFRNSEKDQRSSGKSE